jgi:CheY-like chemotaxis protein
LGDGPFPREGTRVTVSLPAAEAGPAPAPARLPVVVSADDDQAFSVLFRPVLAEIAERVVQVADGSGVLDAARREHASAIVVDLDMPGVDGYEVLRRLSADTGLAAVPVVVVTGYPPELVDRARLGHARATFRRCWWPTARLGSSPSTGVCWVSAVVVTAWPRST